MDFCKNLREIRINRKMTQQSLADTINIALRTYQHYEKGDREPALSTLMALADTLGVSTDQLLGQARMKEGEIMDLGKRLRESRMKRKKSQQEMADRIGVALQSYQRYEQGDREPSLSTLVALADVLHVSTDYLLGREDRSSCDL